MSDRELLEAVRAALAGVAGLELAPAAWAVRAPLPGAALVRREGLRVELRVRVSGPPLATVEAAQAAVRDALADAGEQAEVAVLVVA